MADTTPAQAGALDDTIVVRLDADTTDLIHQVADDAFVTPDQVASVFTAYALRRMERNSAALARDPAPQAPADTGEASLEVRTLARDIQYAIADEGIAPASPADYNTMREVIIRVLRNRPAPAHAAGEERAATLWCLHIVGPDDVHPAPSREHAQRAADLFNAAFADKRDLMHAVASPWPHTPASHAKSVDRFIADWMVPRGEVAAAAPPPPAGDAGEVQP